MQKTEISWSQTEKKIAEQAFNKAYERESSCIVEAVRDQASKITKIDDLWYINDFLNARRHDLDGKYDYRESNLIFVFATLIKQKWLQIEELEGLTKDKLAKIAALTRI